MLEVGASLGLRVQHDENTLALDASQIGGRGLEREHTDALSGTLLFMAPLLARRRHARMTIDYAISRLHPHLTALRDLGMDVNISGGGSDLWATPREEAGSLPTPTHVPATSPLCMFGAI